MDNSVALWRLCVRPIAAWVGLIALLGITYVLAITPMGSFNLPISLIIAMIKALIVRTIFMQLSEHNPLNRLAASIGPIWIFIMFLLTGVDYFTR